jgi:L-asparaginase II
VTTAAPPVVAEVVRSGFVEGVHCGVVLAQRADGTVALALGDVAAAFFPRSCNKPLQAVAMVRAGLDVDDEQLAVVAASHSGSERHVALVLAILDGARLTSASLDNVVGLPVDEATARALLASGGQPDQLHQNCSGKHAGMLATCVAAGWPVDSYLSPDHPLQLAIRDTIEQLAAEPVSAVGVDGCGAPLFALSLNGLARAFRTLVQAAPGSAEHRVAAAMRANPDVVGGPERVVTRLMRGVPGLLAKDGAEGAFVAAVNDGSVAAVKIADGASRAAAPVLVAALRALGVDEPVLDELATTPIFGGGKPVGEVRIAFGDCERRHTIRR